MDSTQKPPSYPNAPEEHSGFVTPSIALPKGGGAIRGMGEKFSANPVTGAGSMNVPLATSPGRSGFGPQLSLAYDSGSGNGPFGFGWSLSTPAITRKTDQGLPKYQEVGAEDVFILSGAEDLVPLLVKVDGKWQPEELLLRTVDGETYQIRRYRPRIEGLYARIERWTQQSTGETFWRSITRDNLMSWYGRDVNSRILDPAQPQHIFSWLICETRDDKGNAVRYEYKPEDGLGADLSQAHERNRGDRSARGRTANRYLKHIFYGNRTSLLNANGQRSPILQSDPQAADGWMFEVVFDYGEHDPDSPSPNDAGPWDFRIDPFSSYRAGFEIRTTRLCRRALMFHHFPEEAEVGRNCLVRSTDFSYTQDANPLSAAPTYTFLRAVTQVGYQRRDPGYIKQTLPQLEFEYTQPGVQDTVEQVDSASLENLPAGVDSSAYQWTDLHGEGVPGILTEQAGVWYYKRNLSPLHGKTFQLAAMELVALKPNLALSAGAQFMDLAGDGQIDLVVQNGPLFGLYEHDAAEGWQPFRPFTAHLNRDLRDPNLKFIDLDGDGHADVMISENEAFVWHVGLGEAGFGPAQRVVRALDEEKGPRMVFSDGAESIYLVDFSGDGLTDLARIRNGEVCYWPNLGYGKFGAKVTMDNAPWFDHPDQFNPRRLRLADIDGSGTTDLIYLHRNGVRLYFNQSGNRWSEPRTLRAAPRLDDLVNFALTDLLGNGTACLVWSSSLPGDAQLQMRYIDLMGGQKPHLLIKTRNNLGAETEVNYAPSTRFYLQDRLAGKPWVTRLPFPVHVVERVVTFDQISHNRFTTQYRYHHGYFAGEEREFRGFGMVEEMDTQELAALAGADSLPKVNNQDPAAHLPPVLTRSWFHTGIYLGRERVSNFFAGLLNDQDPGEYYREPGQTPAQARAQLLDDTLLPADLAPEDEREACRALKGLMLRQEIYALDGSTLQDQPYRVTEQNFTLKQLQPAAGNRHAVFFAHPREAINYSYERNPADARISHALTLTVDNYGNQIKSVVVGYGRRAGQSPLIGSDLLKQEKTLVTYTENDVTNAIDDPARYPDDYRAPQPSEARTYELTGLTPAAGERFSFHEFEAGGFQNLAEIPYEQPADPVKKQKRLIECLRTCYRKDDLTSLLARGVLEPHALPGESYKLALTPGLLGQVFMRNGQNLLPLNLGNLLAGGGIDHGGYVDLDGLGQWWIPSGLIFLSPTPNDLPPLELAYAKKHFFLSQRFRSPFHTPAFNCETQVVYDRYDLLVVETRDATGSRVSVGERRRDLTLNPTRPGNDYRVLQPRLVTDPNGNCTEVCFNVLGLVAGTAVMGKAPPAAVEGDSLTGFTTNLPQAEIEGFMQRADPHIRAPDLLQKATSRTFYDLERFQRTRQAYPQDPAQWLPATAVTLVRETHAADPLPPQGLQIQLSFTYSDGFGREIQKKMQAEPGPVPMRDAQGKIIVGADHQPQMSAAAAAQRWVGTGWTVFNNKGKPVRKYEPFFSDTRQFEFDVRVGLSPLLFYDPVERLVATLHPNHTYEKIIFSPWQQTSYDVNDTIKLVPDQDEDVRGFFIHSDGSPRIPTGEYLPTWYDQRIGVPPGDPERQAAEQAVAHAATPTVIHLDSLGRTFLTLADNGPDPQQPNRHLHFATRVDLDIEGNQLAVTDAKGRVVMRYHYDLLGSRIHQASMEAGERWTLNDAAGKPLAAWDTRGHDFTYQYDGLHRPTAARVRGGDGLQPLDHVYEQIVYGENQLLNGQTDQELNLRGKPFAHFDTAGKIQFEAYDFKGNLRRSTRTFLHDYAHTVNWAQAAAPALEAESFESRTSYDALNRPTQLVAPHSDRRAGPQAVGMNVIQPGYNAANLLERVEVWLEQPVAPAGLLNAAQTPPAPVGVDHIAYDAGGRREQIHYKNGAVTHYTYDPQTSRLTQMYTRRGAAFAGDCDNPLPHLPVMAAPEKPPANTPCGLQNLYYSYDPVGNLATIRDQAQPSTYFRNQRVDPGSAYTYDAIYRLIAAQGREHLGQAGGQLMPPRQTDSDDSFHLRQPTPNGDEVMGRYRESYTYDEVGNFEQIRHTDTSAANANWTRLYFYDPDPFNPNRPKNNRLVQTTPPGPNEGVHTEYTYDAHGNMTSMPHLTLMRWDFRDQLQASAQQVVNPGGTPEMTYYVYDAAGQRIRKVTERQAAPGQAPVLKQERLYLDGFEIYREYNETGKKTILERNTQHIMDDKQRIALVETRTLDSAGTDRAPRQLIRYQFGNHLGSASLELDDQARVLSYEEYFPFGSTSYQASQMATPKRYRFTAKERDDESGLYYHGARYYAPWLGRWTRPDPLFLKDSTNTYLYALNNPIIAKDPTGGPVWLIPVAIYLGYKALESAAETGLEAGIAKATDDESFSPAGSFVKNMAVNSVVGLIPGASEAKIGTKAALYATKLAMRTAGDTTLDTLQGKGTLEENLQKNALANVGGDVAGALLKKGAKEVGNVLAERAAKEAAEKAAREAAEKAAKEAAEKAAKEAAEKAAKEAAEKAAKEAAEKAGTEAVKSAGDLFEERVKNTFSKKIIKSNEILKDEAGKVVGQIDFETAEAIVEVGISLRGKMSQLHRLAQLAAERGKRLDVVYGPDTPVGTLDALKESLQKRWGNRVRFIPHE